MLTLYFVLALRSPRPYATVLHASGYDTAYDVYGDGLGAAAMSYSPVEWCPWSAL